MPDHPALQPFLSNWHFFASLLALLILLKIFASPAFKGWLGEALVIRAGLKKLDPSSYRHFHDLYLPRPDGQGSTQIDHVVVSPYGIFVIETKNYRGWIFGSEKQKQWTQQIHRHKNRFQNPLHQNKLHVRALMDFLELPGEKFSPLVFFIGNAQFKTEMPDNVLNHGLVRWIKNHTTPRLAPSQFEQIASRLDHLDRTTNRRTAARLHLQAMKKRQAA